MRPMDAAMPASLVMLNAGKRMRSHANELRAHQVYDRAVRLSAAALGVPPRAVRGSGNRRTPVARLARAMASYLSIVEAGVPVKALARVSGVPCQRLRSHCGTIEERRDGSSELDRMIDDLAQAVG